MATQAHPLPPGTSHRLPPIGTRLPDRCHRSCAELDRQSERWARPYLEKHFGDADIARRYLRRRPNHFACSAFPTMRGDRALDLTNLMIPVALCDETFRDPGVTENYGATKALHTRWSSVFAGREPPPSADPVFRMVFTAIEAAERQMTPHLARRARRAWREIADSHLDEAKRWPSATTVDLDRYLKARRTTALGWWLTTHLEYALGIDLCDLAVAPRLTALRRAVVHHLVLVRDLYFFAPEPADPHPANAVGALVRRGRMSVQAAVDRLAQVLDETEIGFLERRTDILAGDLGPRSDVRAYVDGLGHLMSGNLRWAQEVSRPGAGSP
ncbi:terpene synthase family protein [Nocardia sp. NPDC004068]|uniref:terpene synthase family protein n=1 Tax=Nocardia sp. NPDC004068 TaxID=3364303 RepID=UPI003680ADAF